MPSIVSTAVKPITTIYPKLWFSKVPEPARFFASAGLGNIIFFYIDIILYDLVIHPLSLQDFSKKFNSNNNNIGAKILLLLLPPKSVLQKNKESISFFISYLIQILAQHFLNAFFVYGLETISNKDKYMSTLFVTYSSYFVSLIGSTICNISLLRKGMSKNVAFWGTVFGFGFFNYLALKFLIGGQAKKQVDVDGGVGNTARTAKGRGNAKGNDNVDKRDNSRTKRSMNRNNNNNSNNNKNNNSNRNGRNTSDDNNNVRNRWRMRGGGQIYNEDSYINNILVHILNETNLFVEGLTANSPLSSSSPYDHHMAFVKSVGRGIELNRKM